MTTRRMLSKTLEHLSSGELEEFCLHVELEKGVPLLSELDLKSICQEKIVKLMVKRCSKEECVKLTRNILKKMNRTDLVKRLLDDRRESEEEHSMDEEPLSLTQRVEKMTSVIELLVEIMAYLTEDQYEEFKKLIRYEGYETYNSYNPRLLWKTNHQDIACVTVLTFGQNSVVKTMKILKRMNRTDLVQKLLETSSSFKKKPSDEPRSVLLEKAATIAAVKDLLLEILHSLNNGELEKFQKFLLSAFQTDSKDIPYLLRHSNERTVILDVMVQTYGRQSVDETRKILKKLHRVDLMQMFSETSSEPKVDEHQPPVFEKTVKEDVKHVLLETLSGLKLKEFEKFKWVLQLTYFQRSFTRIQWYDMEWATTPDELVHQMVMNQQPLEVTKEVLLDMNRTDLVERLMGTDSGLQEKHRPEQPHQTSTITSLHWTLWETLRGLRYEEHELFKQHLLQITQQKGLPEASERQMKKAGRDGIVMLMVDIYGQQSVELTKDVLQRMNKTDLVGKLSESSSGFNTEKKLQQKDSQHKFTRSLHWTLRQTLRGLRYEDQELFKQHLLHIAQQKGLPGAPKRKVKTANMDDIVMLMVEIYGQQSVELTKDVLYRMNKTALLKKLSRTSSGFNTENKLQQKDPQHQESTMTPVHSQLLETLEELGSGDLEKFKHALLYTKMKKGLPKIPRDQVETADKDEIVKLMVEIYGQRCVEVTKDILERMM
ncbi:uncharacterized protein LOC132983624 isoform X2 [Labrus mixtus]|nr:uncharacterized protein LOC132983624 isoform X2 [Labrus mixtus]XP_060905996.1 uncharacterized protein LOC132983624 isoform X2 [Labrus mixtus]XP_060905997.1 uncharacterized protein LOC132983624 isoform X2 [Labrus mixtus]XP_060905998.1 uncharacterized protein LOC132983624 isoform X2 [Labrus mixtus]